MAIIEKRNASSQIIDYILNQIIDGELKEGDKLPNERGFAEMLGVSRVPLREAITALSLIGILTPRQGEGTFVSKYNPEIFGQAIYANVVMEGTDIDDIMRVRCMIESNAAEFASSVANENDIVAICRAKDEHASVIARYLEDRAKFEEIITADYAFHNAIAAATHNTFFKQFFDVLKHSIRYCHVICINKPERFPGFVEDHNRICDAIMNRQQHEAYRTMFDHVSDYEVDDAVAKKVKHAYEYRHQIGN